MVNQNILIGIGLLILMVLSVVCFSSITGDTITGSVINNEEIKNEYFEINNINKKMEENLNDSQNNSRPE